MHGHLSPNMHTGQGCKSTEELTAAALRAVAAATLAFVADMGPPPGAGCTWLSAAAAPVCPAVPFAPATDAPWLVRASPVPLGSVRNSNALSGLRGMHATMQQY